MEKQVYVNRLIGISNKRFKTFLQPINPYRIGLKKWVRGSCLEVGCGIGRNLGYLNNPDNLGIDLNEHAVSKSRSLGHQAITTEHFESRRADLPKFDNLLFSHVLEHMDYASAVKLIESYLPALNESGAICIICPQERGFASDPTHVEFMNIEKLTSVIKECGLVVHRSFSYPLPRLFGRLFIYNEFVMIVGKTGALVPDSTKS